MRIPFDCSKLRLTPNYGKNQQRWTDDSDERKQALWQFQQVITDKRYQLIMKIYIRPRFCFSCTMYTDVGTVQSILANNARQKTSTIVRVIRRTKQAPLLGGLLHRKYTIDDPVVLFSVCRNINKSESEAKLRRVPALPMIPLKLYGLINSKRSP